MRENRPNKFNDSLRDRMRTGPSKPSTGLSSIWAEQKQIEKEEELERKKRKALQKQKISQHKANLKSKAISGKKSAQNIFQRVIKTKRKLLVASGVSVALIVAVFAGFKVFNNDSPKALLGDSTVILQSEEDLKREQPVFSLLFPTGTDDQDYDVVRLSPPEAAASYTYLDRLTEDGQIFKVTQQEIPDNFDLAKVATDFQATSIIQVDDDVIYHGYSERGGVQSLFFIKDNKLVSIRSPQKFSDDLWANYFISLK